MRLRSVLGPLTVLCLLWSGITAQAQTWRGLRVTPESRCSPYLASEYSYPQSIEARIIESLGGIWSPYTGRTFASRRETDIEHIVARSEAHDSGLCAATAATRRRFATDLLNLTLASPDVNRGQKNDRDAAAWVPDRNQCWFADRVVRVRQKYNLTIDRREANALDQVLVSCASTTLVRGGALQRVDGTNRLVPTKSGKSRKLEIGEIAKDALMRRRTFQLEEKLAAGGAWSNKLDLIFTTRKGTPLEASVPNRIMDRLLKKAGIRHLSPHGLRHSCATLMMAAGENAKVIAEKLGHSTTAFTLDVYAHVGPTLQEEASARMDQRMGWKR